MPRKPDWFFLLIMFALLWLFAISLLRAVLDEDWWALITIGPMIIVAIAFAVSIGRLMRKLTHIERGDTVNGNDDEDAYAPTKPLQ